MAVEGLPTGPRKNIPPVPKPMKRLGGAEKAQADTTLATLKENEAARAAEAAMEARSMGRFEDDGGGQVQGRVVETFKAAPVEDGDVPSWDAVDLKETAMGGMGMAPELDTDQHRFGDPRALNMVQAVDLPVTEEKKKKKAKQKVDMKAMVLGTADIYDTQMEEEEKPSAKEVWEAEKGLPSMIVDPELRQEAAEPGVKDIEKAAGPLVGGAAEEAALKQAVEAETAALPEEKKRGLLQGALNLGVQLTTLVNDSAAAMADRLSRNCADSNSLYCRLALSTKTLFKTRADNTRRLLEGEDGLLSRKGVAKAVSVYSWARAATAIGAFGGAEIARRTSMAALGVAGTSLEIAKEARLKNMDLREQVGAERVRDMDAAAEEAWAMYEEAKASAKGKAPTAEQLSNKFGERLPKALLERLAKKPEGVAMGFAERLAEKDLRRTLEKIQAKLDAIENGPGTDAEKRARREQLMAGGVIAKQWGSYLKDADRFLTAAGTVDMLGYSARAAERTAKGARTALVLLSLGALAKRGWDAFSSHETVVPAEASSVVGGESLAPETTPTAPLGDAEVMTAESRDLPPGIVSMETVGAGGSITGSLMKQLEEHPEKFGYTGDTGRSSEQLHAWAFKTAKQMAKSAGFLTRKDQQDTWLSAAAIGKLHIGVDMSHGKPELAMVDADGHVMSAAELKAGPYGMKIPFADKGEATPVTPEVVSPDQRPAAAADYYLKKMLGAEAAALSPAQQKELGTNLFKFKHYEQLMRDESLSPESRAEAKKMALALLTSTTQKYGDTLGVGWTEKMHNTEPYTAYVTRAGGEKELVSQPTSEPAAAVEQKEARSHVETEWEKNKREFATENLKRAQAIIGVRALEGLTQEQRVEVGKLLRAVDLRHQDLHASVADGTLSVGDEIQYRQPYRRAVEELEEKYGKVLPNKWLGKLTRYMHPEASEDHEHHNKEGMPTPPVKPLRRPPVQVEPTPEPAPAPLLVLDGVEHPERVEVWKDLITPDFNNLSTDPNDPQSKNVALLILQRAHEAKEILAKLPPGAPVPPAVTERIAELKEFVNESVLSTVLKPDWFEKV